MRRLFAFPWQTPAENGTGEMALPLQATDLSVQIPLVRGLAPLRPRNQQNDY